MTAPALTLDDATSRRARTSTGTCAARLDTAGRIGYSVGMENNRTATTADIPAAWAEVTSLTLQESGDYAGLATSESDVYAPAQPIQFFVPREGGKVRADVLGPERRTEGGDLIGDPWEYDVDCGITLTVDEVSALLG